MNLDLNTLRAPWALLPNFAPTLVNLARDSQPQARAGEPVTSPAGGKVAIVPIHGPILNRDAWAALLGWPTYQGIEAAVRKATNDPGVEEIILSFDSPGGVALNTDEAAQAIREATSVKPVTAVANGFMASGAYWLAAQASEIVTTPLSFVGSIGVITMHADFTRLYDDNGIDLQVYRTGDLKALGQPVDPNDELLEEHHHAQLTDILNVFAGAVAAGRGMSKQDVLARFALNSDHPDALRGDTVLGERAVTLGLADRVGTLTSVTTTAAKRHQATARARLSTRKDPTMNELLARLGLTEDATPEQVQAALTTLEEQAATRANAKVAKALSIDATTDQALTTVASEAADGRQYRSDLLDRLHAAVIRAEGNDQAGRDAADRAKRIFTTAAINDLTAEVARLEAKPVTPEGRKSVDEPDTPARAVDYRGV